SGATLTGVSSGGILGTPSALPPNWTLVSGWLLGPGANLVHANFSGLDLAGLDLAGADLNSADLDSTDLSGATLTGVSSGVILGTPSALPTNWTLMGGYLLGPGADLVVANLSGLDLAGLDLAGANLSSANLNSANLDSADLSGATLAGVLAGGIVGTPSALPPNWTLIGGWLIGPDVNLSFANLSGLDLADVDLAGATLSSANLNFTDLDGANLSSAYLDYADLDGASLSGAQVGGIYWFHTTCPDGTSSDSDGGTCVNDL
ncbi:MAG: pentapeptide repeat-containing protein, partial [Acidimicrobiales bacterium]